MVITTVQDVSVNYGPYEILKSVNLTLNDKERVGIIGRNGAGKSTLLKIIAGAQDPDSGSVIFRRDLHVTYVPQTFELDNTLTVEENIKLGATELLNLIDAYSHAPSDELEARITAADGWTIQQRMEQLMQQLNTPPSTKRCGDLSGGERRRVAICKALISKPDLLILDEPTNHLDTESIEWLENFLASYRGACLFVTHDRYFLDNIATRIVEVEHGNIYSYQGNYSDYLVTKAEREQELMNAEQRRQSFIRREIDWIRRGPKARTTKSKSRIQRFDDAVNQGPLVQTGEVELIMPEPDKLSTIILELNNLTIERENRTLLKDLTLHFEKGQKIGLVGKNGTGKSSLIKTILNELAPSGGAIRLGENTRFNYIDQERVALDESKTVVDEVGDGKQNVELGSHKISIWGYLKRFLFTDERINTIISQLSGGEKSRILLAKQLKYGGNFLILDEPTNDLDLHTLRVLEESLANFPGCVLLVSHDRYFMNRVCTHTLAFEGDGKFTFTDGNYDYYQEKKKAREKAQQQNEVVVKEDNLAKTAPIEKKRRLTWKEKKEFENIESDIMEAELAVEEIENIFIEPDFHQNHGHRVTELTEQLNERKKQVETLYARWEELSELAD